MIRFLLWAAIAYSMLIGIAPAVVAQHPEQPPPKQTAEIKKFAADFFNEYRKTGKLEKLIKKYFVSDFPRRLAFCRSTRSCGGFGRDFWTESKLPLQATPAQLVTHYARSIDFVMLLFQFEKKFPEMLNFAENADDDEASLREFQSRLAPYLKDDPAALNFLTKTKFVWWSAKPKSLIEFNTDLDDQARFNELMQRVLVMRRRASARDDSTTVIEFDVYVKTNSDRFFDFPEGTKTIDVWPEVEHIPLTMDIIRAGKKLKIIAVYPPID
jgi:hypothetical protein